MTLTERIARCDNCGSANHTYCNRPQPVQMPEWRRRMLEGKTESERYRARKDTTVQ